MKTSTTAEQKRVFGENWAKLIAEINNNLESDPKSETGIALGKRCMELINGLYGRKYAHLRTKKFEKGFGEGKGLDEVGLTPEAVSWLEKAADAYWRDCIYGVLDQVGKAPSSQVLTIWKDVLDDMYGEGEEVRKKAVYEEALKDDKISKAAKQFLRQFIGM